MQLVKDPQNADSDSNSNSGESAWNTLLPQWQCCIEEAWTSYCKGSLPIGAVITDEKGELIARGRNRIYEDDIYEDDGEHQILRGNRLAHAEMNALLKVNWKEVDPKKCILYTTTEPCPLCIGAVRLTRIRMVYYASRDTGAGSAYGKESLFTANEFMRRAHIQVKEPQHADMETILTAMLVETMLRRDDNNMSLLYDTVAAAHPIGASLGQYLFTDGLLDRWKKEGRSAAYTYDQLSLLLPSSDSSTGQGSQQINHVPI